MVTAYARRRRVLHVAQPVEAGVAVVVRQMVEHQVALGYDVAVACPPSGSLPEWARKAGATVLPWTATRSPDHRVIAETTALRRLIRRWAPDLVHLHSSKAGLAGRLAVHGYRPTIYQPHGWSFLAVTGMMRMLTTGWERVASRWTDAFVCISDAERGLGASLREEANWNVCPNGIDLEHFRPPTSDEQSAARDFLGLSDQLVVLCVGRLCEQKGQDILLRAWEKVPTSPSSVLVLIGDGPTREELEKVAGGRVIFAGHTTDVRPWYRAAAVVVQPSRWEGGASLTTREAMATGVSVIAADVGGVRELVHAGCGAIVRVDDVAALTEAITGRLVRAELRSAEGAEGRRVAERYLSLEAAQRTIDRLYDEVLRSRR